MYSSTLPSTSALEGVGGQRHVPAALSLGKTRYPLYKEAGWAPGTVWMEAGNSPHRGSIPGTVQTVASHYTDCAIVAHNICLVVFLKL